MSSGNIAPRSGYGQSQPTITKIVTSKEWVLPPRPKPGRKPSVDTPSTKRKAQNRALQRLFRERRANRVSELEDKILEIERERSIKEGLMNNHIKNLTQENLKLNRIIEELKRKTISNKSSPMVLIDENTKTNKYISPISSAATSPNTTSLPPPKQSDCGVCSKDDCICESVGIKRQIETIEQFKPMALVPLKKRKLKEETELDFTTKFKFKKMPDLTKLTNKEQTNEFIVAGQQEINLITNAEEETNCGFCSDDTPCVCRELAKEVANLNKMNELLNKQIETSLPPLKNISRQHSLPTLHPGPSVEFNKTTKRNSILESTCTGNPGTCSQCQLDPMSTLFCTTILQKDENDEIQKTAENLQNLKKIIPTTTTTNDDNFFISTADAYKTLSRHENFNLINFNTLIGKLTTRGMLVEAGSVASVLRELDRKFSCSQ